jgi:hypothetical protein
MPHRKGVRAEETHSQGQPPPEPLGNVATENSTAPPQATHRTNPATRHKSRSTRAQSTHLKHVNNADMATTWIAINSTADARPGSQQNVFQPGFERIAKAGSQTLRTRPHDQRSPGSGQRQHAIDDLCSSPRQLPFRSQLAPHDQADFPLTLRRDSLAFPGFVQPGRPFSSSANPSLLPRFARCPP